MTRHNHNPLCRQAELHYYDFLCAENRGLIPGSIIGHIEQCRHCRQRLNRLKEVLSQAETGAESKQRQIRTIVTNMLQLHLACIGKRVTCRTARPFLPGMLDAALEIKVPTPITVHLDNCRQCREDLEAIRELNLDRNQLWQLHRIFAGQPCDESPVERAKMQELQKTAGRITERPESGVVTVYTIDESAQTRVRGESDDIYAGFPIRVEVTGSEEAASEKLTGSTINFAAVLRQRLSAMNFGPLVKPAVAACAVLLITAALFFSTLTVKAVTIERVYKVIEKVKNVYIAKFTYKTEPEQEPWVSRTQEPWVSRTQEPRVSRTHEQWISKTLHIYISKTGGKTFLWDIGNGLKKTKNPDTGAVETATLTDETRADIGGRMSGYLGLVPFTDMSDIPADAEWSRVTYDSLEAAAEGIEVYDLMWIEGKRGGSVRRKWRAFIDPKTDLPQRTELYEESPDDNEYTLKSVKLVEYLSDSEMQAILDEAFF